DDVRVVLRAFRDGDETALRALVDDELASAWNPVDATDLPAWMSRQNESTDEFVTWAVASGEDDRFLGTVSGFHIDAAQSTGELGYRVVPAERGRGVATAALGLAAQRLFDERGLRRLQLFHAVDNVASCVVAERAGFPWEGTLRQSYVYGDGRPHDEHLHARLATDG
ncbi:MAG: GNAT family N-acetyltransferase, partial [Marmoricola sp.]|nr:GNAT family N-acetyltransferase [Marmoricola sp.]